MPNPEFIDVDSSDTESCISSASSSPFEVEGFTGFVIPDNEPLSTYCFIALRSILLRFVTTEMEYSSPKWLEYINHIQNLENQHTTDAARLHSAKMLIYALTQHVTFLESSQ